MFFNNPIANFAQPIAAAGGGYAKNIVTDGLICYIDAGIAASNPGSGTTWYDLTPNAFNFTLVNGAAFGGSGASAYVSFDGTNDYASNDSATLSSIGTLSGFTYQVVAESSATTEDDLFATDGIGSEASFLLMFYGAANSVRNHLWTNGGIGVPDNTNGGGPPENTRFGLGGGADWTLTRVYSYKSYPTSTAVNVTPSGTQPTTTPYTGVQLGTRSRSTGAFLNGRVYNMVIYNRSLTQAEIDQNWTALV
jgi:hypothetical protein